jgi:4-amino-4-deoxy-L-arabinose transferase-like glycosyltransferase
MEQPARWLLGARPYFMLAALCLLLYLPGVAAIPPLDRDEARFAQATRQMLQTGDFLRIRFQDEARNKKPAGIYWLQAAAVSALSTPASTAIWPYRLPSLLGGLGAVLLLFACGARLFGAGAEPAAARRTALFAALLLASAVGVVAEAHIAKTDAALLAAIVAGQGALGAAYVAARCGRPVPVWIAAAFWAGETVAIMLKGPVGPALALTTAAALSLADRDWRWLRQLRPAAGVLGLAAATVPWLFAIQKATGGGFLGGALGQDFLQKLVGAQESHGAPPFSYLLLAVATFWPGSLLLVPAVLGGWRRRERPAERFLLAWLVPAWVFVELVPTKLPHYTLPLYPALALLAAAALTGRAGLAFAGWARWLDLAVKALWVVVSVLLAALLVGLPLRFGGGLAPAGLIGAVLVAGLTAALLWRRPGAIGTIVFVVGLALAFVVPAGTGVLPGLDRLWLSRAAAGLVAEHRAIAGQPVVTVGYSEPSLVFLLGTGLRMTTPGGAADALGGGGMALVGNREEPMFHQAVSARGLVAAPVGSVRGLDYSNGQGMVLTLYRITPG